MEMTGEPGFDLVSGVELHEKVIREAVLGARKRVWIATADLKDMHIPGPRGYEPVLRAFDRMAREGVLFRVIHGAVPSRPFRDTLEKHPGLFEKALELQICPRSHWKMVIVDSAFAYFGSANFTGAGLGARRAQRRNLEIGAVTSDPRWVLRLERLYDEFWMGSFCGDCAYRDRCPDPI